MISSEPYAPEAFPFNPIELLEKTKTVMAKYPSLGAGPVGPRAKTLQEERRILVNSLPAISACVSYLQGAPKRSLTTPGAPNSCWVKHLVEEWSTKVHHGKYQGYIPQGAVVVAAVILGYSVGRNTKGIDWFVGIRRDWHRIKCSTLRG